jgi:hypothetical protein
MHKPRSRSTHLAGSIGSEAFAIVATIWGVNIDALVRASDSNSLPDGEDRSAGASISKNARDAEIEETYF